MTGAEAVLETLARWKVEYFFGCPGTTEVPILDALINRKEPKFILCVHECTAVSSADGYARVTGRPGVVTLHANVGLANGISHIHNASVAGSPLLIINFIKSRRLLGRRGFTSAHDHQEMVKQYTKWDWQVLTEESLVEDLERALRLTISPPMGPTYLAIPQDILEADIEDIKIEGPPRANLYSRPSRRNIDESAEILSNAEFPLIISGANVAQENALDSVVRLANILASPVCSEHRLNFDYNSYPTEEEHFVGPFHPDAEFVEKSDVILAIGCRLFIEFEPPQKPWIKAEKKLIHLNSDPKEIGHIYPVEVGLLGAVKEGVEELVSIIGQRLKIKDEVIINRKKKINQFHEAFIKRRNEYFNSLKDEIPLKVGILARELAKIINHDTTLIADAVTSNEPLVQYLPRYNSKSFYASSSGASLGWGMGAAIGVKLGDPKRNVICVTGDGSFIFGLPALHTARKYNIPVGFIIINNSSYAAVKAGLLRYKREASQRGIFPGTDIGGPDYTAIAKGFGVASFKVESEKDLSLISKANGEYEGPVLVEMITDPEDVGRVER